MQYNAAVEVQLGVDDLEPSTLFSIADELVDALRDFHPAVGRSPSDRVQITLTIDADNINTAIIVVIRVLHELLETVPIRSFQVLPTEDFDRQYGLVGI